MSNITERQHRYSLVTAKFPMKKGQEIDLQETYLALRKLEIEAEYDPENGFKRVDFLLNGRYRFQVFSNGSVIINCKGPKHYSPRVLQQLLDRVQDYLIMNI